MLTVSARCWDVSHVAGMGGYLQPSANRARFHSELKHTLAYVMAFGVSRVRIENTSCVLI